MARFTAEQSQAYVEIQQLIHDWGYELDHCYGENIGDLLAEDCTYFLAGTPREGRAVGFDIGDLDHAQAPTRLSAA